MEQASIIGIDWAKHSFQIHCAAADGSVLLRKMLSRRKIAELSVIATAAVHAIHRFPAGGGTQRPAR